VSDPVGAGLIEKIGIPTGQNITGLVAALPRETQLKFAVSLAKQIIPDRPIVIGVVTSDYPASIGDLRMLKEAAALQKDVVIREVIFPYRDMPRYLDDMLADAAEGIRSIEGQVDFWWEVSGPLGEVPEFASMMLKVSNKPVLYGNIMESVKTGALFSMQQDIKKSAAEAARLAQDILGGADPGLIPVLPPRDFTMGINISTALDLHIVVPPEMLKLAGANVFR
jgi:putative tryptophan/tyrosine transport system substrate-binding protein